MRLIVAYRPKKRGLWVPPPGGRHPYSTNGRNAPRLAASGSSDLSEARAAAPEHSPERQKLAEAIAYLNALDGQLRRLAAARERLDWGSKIGLSMPPAPGWPPPKSAPRSC
jgi:hypothetical protein